jgi:hypothetical protein
MKGFGVSQDVLERVYSSLVESILMFNMTVWYGNLSVRSKTKLTRIVNTASKVIGRPQAHLSSLFHRTNKKKALVVVGDLSLSHPLHPQVEKLQNAHGQEECGQTGMCSLCCWTTKCQVNCICTCTDLSSAVGTVIGCE